MDHPADEPVEQRGAHPSGVEAGTAADPVAGLLVAAATAWAAGDAPAAFEAWRRVARIDPARLPHPPPDARAALLIAAARFVPVEVPEAPAVERVHFDPGVDDVDTATPGIRAALAWVGPPEEPARTSDPPVARREVLTPRRGVLIAGATSCALASAGTYLLAVREERYYFTPGTAYAALPEARATTNRLVGASGVLATSGLVLGAAAVITW